MIALRLLPLALLAATAANAQMVTNEVPPPRVLQPVSFVPARGGFIAATYRETPMVLAGSSDRFIPVMIEDGDDFAAYDDGPDSYFDDGYPGDGDDGYYGR